jgi:hypothetical protein
VIGPVVCQDGWTVASSSVWVGVVLMCWNYSLFKVLVTSDLTTCFGPCSPRPHSCEPTRSHLAAGRSISGLVSARQVGSSWVPSQQAPSATHLYRNALLVCTGSLTVLTQCSGTSLTEVLFWCISHAFLQVKLPSVSGVQVWWWRSSLQMTWGAATLRRATVQSQQAS